jgi:uncharacterized protein
MTPAAPNHRRAYLFLGLTLAWTWAFWWTAAALGRPATDTPVMVLFAVGGAGPMVVALAMVLRLHDRADRREFFARIIDPRRIGLRWWPVILLLPALVSFGSFGLYWVFGGEFPALSNPRELIASPLSLLGLLGFLLVFGPLPEEIGWRGYAQDQLRNRHGMLAASLLIGVVWWAWHLPLFFIEGSYHSRFDTLHAVTYLPSVVALAVIHTWLFFKTDRSTLGAILLHFAVNFTGEFLSGPPEAKPWATALYVTLALAIAATWLVRRPGNLSG